VKNPIWLLSGFLGGENHWGDFSETLAQHIGVRPEIFNWFNVVEGAKSLAEAGRFLAQRAYAEGTRPVLIGYSMGGRLALQAAIEAPSAFSGIVALSAHTGFAEDGKREARKIEDTAWAKLLREDPAMFWQKWNQRGSLHNTTNPTPPDFSQKESWAHALVNMGTGAQDYFPPLLLNKILPPLMAIAGARDEKFVHNLKEYPKTVQTHVIEDAGHRLPLEAPTELARLLAPFIRQTQDIL